MLVWQTKVCAESFFSLILIAYFLPGADVTGMIAQHWGKPTIKPPTVSLALGRKTLNSAKGNPLLQNEPMEAGLLLWAPSALEANERELATLRAKQTAAGGASAAAKAPLVAPASVISAGLSDKEAMRLLQLEAAIATQVHTRAVHQAGIDAAAAYANPALPPMERVFQAFAIAAGALPARVELYFNPTRLALATKAFRLRHRVLAASVNQVINFAVSKTPSNVDGSATRLPVIYVGDRVNNRKASRSFPMQRFLHLLARKAIVVICSEHRTTKCCGDCGHFNVQPRKAYSTAKHRGTMYCENLECPSRGRFTNRDVQAACNIVDRFICAFVLGGTIGLCGRVPLLVMVVLRTPCFCVGMFFFCSGRQVGFRSLRRS